MSSSAPSSPRHPSSQRRFTRYTLDSRIYVHAFRDGGLVSLWGRSNELGEDGIGGTLTGELEMGEVVSLELSLPLASHPIKLRAIVRYRKGLRHGFEFLSQSEEQRDVIHRVCEMLQGML
jgi:hypothetical protein